MLSVARVVSVLLAACPAGPEVPQETAPRSNQIAGKQVAKRTLPGDYRLAILDPPHFMQFEMGAPRPFFLRGQ
jgi:hypothetical protein